MNLSGQSVPWPRALIRVAAASGCDLCCVQITMMFKVVCAIAAVIVVALQVDATPSYITKCKRDDPKLDECILKNAQKAVPEIMKGDANLQIPDLNAYDPLDQTLTINGVTYILQHLKHNSGELTPTHTRMNFKDHSAEIGMNLPFLVWKGDFTAQGKYNGKDIDASGKVTIKYDNIQFNYTKNFEDKDINGKLHLQIKSESTIGTIDKISIVHTYDKTKGKEELESMITDIKAALKTRLEEICSSLVTYAMNSVLRSMPKSEIFLP